MQVQVEAFDPNEALKTNPNLAKYRNQNKSVAIDKNAGIDKKEVYSET